ncbi:Glyoxalase/Bleomycin resistance protein/Dihydroxybiphenyl dioxygenase [Chytridium lagenaria]|nr:Glyoxalase/Bleomycin resistance protein/Dihydroxybiphenyl dioxygenase [Chytridium lagenaria]
MFSRLPSIAKASLRTASTSGTLQAVRPIVVSKRSLATASVSNVCFLYVVALACSAKFYKEVLRAKVSEKKALPEHGVYTVFVELGNTKIELLHPYGEKSPIANFLSKNKDGGMHHICLEVDNVYTAMEDIGAHGKPVIFLHPKDCGGVLVELEQR